MCLILLRNKKIPGFHFSKGLCIVSYKLHALSDNVRGLVRFRQSHHLQLSRLSGEIYTQNKPSSPFILRALVRLQYVLLSALQVAYSSTCGMQLLVHIFSGLLSESLGTYLSPPAL